LRCTFTDLHAKRRARGAVMLDLIIRGGDVVSRGACRNVRATGTAARAITYR
jgi:hypothetical protein